MFIDRHTGKGWKTTSLQLRCGKLQLRWAFAGQLLLFGGLMDKIRKIAKNGILESGQNTSTWNMNHSKLVKIIKIVRTERGKGRKRSQMQGQAKEPAVKDYSPKV